MRAELKAHVIPALREMGFRGTFPHFTRGGPTRVDLLTFQFSQWSPGLYVEIAASPSTGVALPSGELVPPDKVRVRHTTRRLRLGSSVPQRDHLFEFDPHTHGPDVYARVAGEILELLATQAEPWWEAAVSPPVSSRLPHNSPNEAERKGTQ